MNRRSQGSEARPIDCREAERLFGLLAGARDGHAAGRPTAVERAAFDAHLAACPHCADLAALADLVVGDPSTAPEPPADLLPAVLAATSGLAEAVVPRDADTLFDGFLGQELAGLAELEPGPSFTEAVLARTSRRSSLGRVWRRFRSETWPALVHRPRFAWEAAWCITLLVVPLAAVAEGALPTARDLTVTSPAVEQPGEVTRDAFESFAGLADGTVGSLAAFQGRLGAESGTFWQPVASFLANPGRRPESPPPTPTDSHDLPTEEDR